MNRKNEKRARIFHSVISVFNTQNTFIPFLYSVLLEASDFSTLTQNCCDVYGEYENHQFTLSITL